MKKLKYILLLLTASISIAKADVDLGSDKLVDSNKLEIGSFLIIKQKIDIQTQILKNILTEYSPLLKSISPDKLDLSLDINSKIRDFITASSKKHSIKKLKTLAFVTASEKCIQVLERSVAELKKFDSIIELKNLSAEDKFEELLKEHNQLIKEVNLCIFGLKMTNYAVKSFPEFNKEYLASKNVKKPNNQRTFIDTLSRYFTGAALTLFLLGLFSSSDAFDTKVTLPVNPGIPITSC